MVQITSKQLDQTSVLTSLGQVALGAVGLFQAAFRGLMVPGAHSSEAIRLPGMQLTGSEMQYCLGPVHTRDYPACSGSAWEIQLLYFFSCLGFCFLYFDFGATAQQFSDFILRNYNSGIIIH